MSTKALAGVLSAFALVVIFVGLGLTGDIPYFKGITKTWPREITLGEGDVLEYEGLDRQIVRHTEGVHLFDYRDGVFYIDGVQVHPRPGVEVQPPPYEYLTQMMEEVPFIAETAAGATDSTTLAEAWAAWINACNELQLSLEDRYSSRVPKMRQDRYWEQEEAVEAFQECLALALASPLVESAVADHAGVNIVVQFRGQSNGTLVALLPADSKPRPLKGAGPTSVSESQAEAWYQDAWLALATPGGGYYHLGSNYRVRTPARDGGER